MREQLIDIDLTLSYEDVVMAGGFEACMPDVMRLARAEAEKQFEQVGGEIRRTVMPQFRMIEASHAILGNVFQIGTRWVGDVPDGADTPTQR